jgi:glycosyltransferase involved in cell wall biosynthesis
LKVALVHDWYTGIGGGEKVSREIISLFPQADVFSLVDFFDAENRKFILHGKSTRNSFIQRFPFARTKYRNYISFFPYAIEQFDLSQYNLIISSSSAVAKGVLTSCNQLHICYCHSPMRYAWDLYHQYTGEKKLHSGLKAWLFKYFMHHIRIWDFVASQRIDHFVANSNHISRRIKKIYNRESTVIYPPVDVDRFTLSEKKEDFYLTVSRLVHYKRVDLIVQAFAEMPDKKLVVIGEGPEFKKIKKKATKNIQLLGYKKLDEMKDYLQRAKAFIFAAEEDFGITPVEAQACGTPVIAFGKGGILETVLNGRTGLFFNEQTHESIKRCILKFESEPLACSATEIREHARQFTKSRFQQEFKNFVESQYRNFHDCRK